LFSYGCAIFIAAKCISNQELDPLIRKCQLCMADPNIKNIADLTKEDFCQFILGFLILQYFYD